MARALADRGARVVVLGGPGDAERVAAVAAGAGGGVETVGGGLSLGGLIGTLRRASLFLGNDSGPRHLAAAVGTPTVAVFTYANSADVVPLLRTWHRLEISWHGGCAVCGARMLDDLCGHGKSVTGTCRSSGSASWPSTCGTRWRPPGAPTATGGGR